MWTRWMGWHDAIAAVGVGGWFGSTSVVSAILVHSRMKLPSCMITCLDVTTIYRLVPTSVSICHWLPLSR
jgi:hypothetical protein